MKPLITFWFASIWKYFSPYRLDKLILKLCNVLRLWYNLISEDDSYDLVTCYCMKPFAGRPMIECSKCLTWIHLSCARIKKTNIPEVFICVKCKNRKLNSVTSSSSVRHKKRVCVWSVWGSRNIQGWWLDNMTSKLWILWMPWIWAYFFMWGIWDLSCFIFCGIQMCLEMKRTCRSVFAPSFSGAWKVFGVVQNLFLHSGANTKICSV